MEKEKKYTFMAIDDDAGDLELLKRQISGLPAYDVELKVLTGLADAKAVLESSGEDLLSEVDLLFVDYHLGEVNGLEFIAVLRESGFEQPVILITGQGSEDVAIEAMRAGVSDYLVKGNYNDHDLFRAVMNAIEKYELRKKIAEDVIRFKEMSITDDLTGLLNRCYFFEELSKELNRADRSGPPFSLIMLDLDEFKKINDTYGHLTGDMVLKKTADIIKKHMRSSDLPCRYGGEEFCIILPDTSIPGAMAKAEKLREDIATAQYDSDETDEKISITCSIGMAQYDTGDTNVNEIIRRADRALYKAKDAGRNKVASYVD